MKLTPIVLLTKTTILPAGGLLLYKGLPKMKITVRWIAHINTKQTKTIPHEDLPIETAIKMAGTPKAKE